MLFGTEKRRTPSVEFCKTDVLVTTKPADQDTTSYRSNVNVAVLPIRIRGLIAS
jgi:hypothetical protein